MSAPNAVLESAVPAGTLPGKGQLWTGRVLEWIAVAFLVMDGVMKLIRPASVIQASAPMGIILPSWLRTWSFSMSSGWARKGESACT